MYMTYVYMYIYTYSPLLVRRGSGWATFGPHVGRGGVRAHHHWSPSAPANTQNSMADFMTEEKSKTGTSSATSGRILRKLYDENEMNTGDLKKEEKSWRKLADGKSDILARRVVCTGRILTRILNTKILVHLYRSTVLSLRVLLPIPAYHLGTAALYGGSLQKYGIRLRMKDGIILGNM